MKVIKCLVSLIPVLGMLAVLCPRASGQESKSDAREVKANRTIGLKTLDLVRTVLVEGYYDRKYHGIDLGTRFKAAEEEIKRLDKNWQINRVIAQVLLDFKDSHTIYIPPPQTHRVDYGITMMMIGGNCLITYVESGSDAASKKLSVGDEILEVNGVVPNRNDLPTLEYLLYLLDPQTELRLKTKRVSDGAFHDLTIKAAFLTENQLRAKRKLLKEEVQSKPFYCSELSDGLKACKLVTFMVDPSTIDKMMKEAHGYDRLILDLRGNSGGYIDSAIRLVSHFFDKDVKVGDSKTRIDKIERIAKGRKGKAFSGEVSVLIDSESASSSEIVARTLQIEKRGKIIGDRSSGAVMAAVVIPLEPRTWPYNFPFPISFMNVTVSDFVMSDGARLESIGLMPDLPAIPRPQAYPAGHDPVLAYAAAQMGVTILAAKAGELGFMRARQFVDPERPRYFERVVDATW